MTDNENGLPLLQLAPPQQQPTFPQQQIQVSPQGAIITILLAPGIGWFTTLDENTMNQTMQLWRQTRKDIADQMRVIEHVRQSKNN